MSIEINDKIKHQAYLRFLRILLLLSFLSNITVISAFAGGSSATWAVSDSDSITASSRDIFFFVQDSPAFPGGDEELKKFFLEKLTYPEGAQNKKLEGQVYVRFEVKKDGTIGEVVVAKSIHPILDSEAVRVVKEMPPWIPGRYDGKPVNSWYTLPVSFHLGEEK
ncbi:MAG: energy transducer TonB [Bacteroidales bacterium]